MDKYRDPTVLVVDWIGEDEEEPYQLQPLILQLVQWRAGGPIYKEIEP